MPSGGRRTGSGQPPTWKRLADGSLQETFQFRPPKSMANDLKTIAHKVDDGVVTMAEILRCIELLESVGLEAIESAVNDR